MKFLFWLANHNEAGQRSLEDPIGIFGHQLRALGHEAIWDERNEQLYAKKDGINVLVEGFTPSLVPILADFYSKGARFICLATEEPTPTGFNWGRDAAMVSRQAVFPDAAKYFEGIFHLVPGQHVTDWFSKYAPTAYVELGYAPTLVRPTQYNAPEPKFDYGFFGSLTTRRFTILKRLSKLGAVRMEGTFPTQDERDRIMQDCKVIVQIRKFTEMGLVSSTRCNTGLNLGRPVIGEPHELSKPWDEIVSFSKRCDACVRGDNNQRGRNFICATCIDNFINLATLTRAMWKPIHARQFDIFKRILTPDFCVGRAFREIGMDISGPTFKRVEPVKEVVREEIHA
jgi:hypothetical protein